MNFTPIIDEEKIQLMWDVNGTFKKSIDQDNPSKYIFYDGPPFATGLPHYGHILAGFIKDSVCRFQTMMGNSVPRRAGFDTHGLPIEYEIEKKYSIKTRAEVDEWGIGNYNNACREIVLTYASEWEKIMNRLGRWIDFKDDYKTMGFDFMNSVWWVFGRLAQKGLIYSSYKVMPYSVACKTPLSNFETQQNYQDIDDTTIYVKFKSHIDDLLVNILVWTTTPWTLPSNLMIAINKDIKYNLVKSNEELYLIAESLTNKVFGLLKKNFEIIKTYNGTELIGLQYAPPFNCYPIEQLKDSSKAFKIMHGDFVTSEDGTGFVHIAPSYGEDDYNVCVINNIIDKTDELFMSINDEGYFVNNLRSLEDLGGVFYKNLKGNDQLDVNTQIINKLKAKGELFLVNKYRHSYPFCWRSDTPLMYRAIKSWFVKVEALKDRMVELNDQINWVPDYVGKAKFKQWLLQSRDWCIARNRYWGTPIPIWSNVDDQTDYIVINSAKELEQLAGLQSSSLTDLHRDKIDQIEFTKDGKHYRRIPLLFDCWFESGSMPYASIGYPYKTSDLKIPADFIAEGIDQTRGWFYTLLVISTALFDVPPFKNVIVNGLILASDGKKMSKRLKNYPDPMEVVNKYGSDALRLYLLHSPACKGDTLKFNESGVHSMVKEIIIPLKNSMQFLISYQELFKQKHQGEQLFDYMSLDVLDTINPLDCYAIKYIGNEITNIKINLSKYLIPEAIRCLFNVIEMLNNQFIKYNRFALKGKNDDQWKSSLSVLKCLLTYLSVNIAPILPYFAEFMSQQFDSSSDSIHLEKLTNYKLPQLSHEQNVMADEMIHVLTIIRQVFMLRTKNDIKMRYPLEKLLIRSSRDVLDIINKHSNFILDELNVMSLDINEFEWKDVDVDIKPNFTEIKKHNPTEIEKIVKIINQLSNDRESILLIDSGMTLFKDGIDVTTEMINIIVKPKMIDNYIAEFQHVNGKNYCLYLNYVISDSLNNVAYGKTIARRFQKMKKDAKIKSTDQIIIGYMGDPEYNMSDPTILDTIMKVCGILPIKLQNIDGLNVVHTCKLYDDETIDDHNLDMILYK
jgi:isoleucyl-tRNA synthetase